MLEHDLLELARALAKVAHAGQLRSDGESYFKHVERVAQAAGKVGGIRAATIGYLHDVIEDTTIPERILVTLGFPDEIVSGVRHLSRAPGERAYYQEYITRLIAHGSDNALRVKLADLEDNLAGDPGSREARYTAAQIRVLNELKRRAAAADSRQAA